MRLLYRDALDRLILTDFRGKPIPPYAILSYLERLRDPHRRRIEQNLQGEERELSEAQVLRRTCGEGRATVLLDRHMLHRQLGQ